MKIIISWDCTAKLDEMNRMLAEFGGTDARKLTYDGYIDECWRYAIEHADTHIRTAAKPVKNRK